MTSTAKLVLAAALGAVAFVAARRRGGAPLSAVTSALPAPLAGAASRLSEAAGATAGEATAPAAAGGTASAETAQAGTGPAGTDATTPQAPADAAPTAVPPPSAGSDAPQPVSGGADTGGAGTVPHAGEVSSLLPDPSGIDIAVELLEERHDKR